MMLALGVCGLVIFQFLALIFLQKTNWKSYPVQKSVTPKISVLIAARDEERDLPMLLRSLEKLEYPEDQLEFIFADDDSQDRTGALLESWCKNRSNAKVFRILPEQFQRFHPNGKANALAILTKEAKGDFFFFTDADCQVSPGWIWAGLAAFGQKVGMVIGITQVDARNFFAFMQELDWWNTLSIVKVVNDLGFSTTGLGNNMVISREAYEKAGGFESCESSLTEDLELSKLVVRAGFSIRQQFSQGMLAHTKAEKDWPALLQQRKRWMEGVMSLSLGWKVLLGLQFAFYPALIVVLIQSWPLGLIAWVVKNLLQLGFLSFAAKKAGEEISLKSGFLFDFYQIISQSLTILYYFWPQKTVWKARKYP